VDRGQLPVVQWILDRLVDLLLRLAEHLDDAGAGMFAMLLVHHRVELAGAHQRIHRWRPRRSAVDEDLDAGVVVHHLAPRAHRRVVRVLDGRRKIRVEEHDGAVPVRLVVCRIEVIRFALLGARPLVEVVAHRDRRQPTATGAESLHPRPDVADRVELLLVALRFLFGHRVGWGCAEAVQLG
jgi:hypothetical protein